MSKERWKNTGKELGDAFEGLAAIGLLTLFALYRCPYCKGRFPMKKPLNTTVCPHCGKDVGAKI